MNQSSIPSPEAIQEHQINIYKQMSFAQKWAVALELKSMAWNMKKAFLKERYPECSEEEINIKLRKIFLYAYT